MTCVQSTILAAMLAVILAAAAPCCGQENVVFEDCFDNELAGGWSWLREQGAHWCVRDGALEYDSFAASRAGRAMMCMTCFLP